jgi:protein-tyrosine phosphatase|tara:strand:+ start:567 stop:986 length:420 start_codon:yes stop_codon:yes gene_type:complete
MFYCEVISGIWVADVDILYSNRFYKDNLIEIVINCTYDYSFPDNDSIQKIRVPVTEQLKKDGDFDKLNSSLTKILKFIHDNTITKNILLVCYDGKNVSALLVALYLIKYGKVKIQNINSLMKSKNDEFSLDYQFSLFSV